MNTELIWKQFLDWLFAMAPKLLSAAIIVGLGWWLSNLAVKLMLRALKRSRADLGVTTFLGSLLKILLKAIVCITAAAQLGMNVTSVVTAVGAAGVTLGLALKDSLSNVASGIQILFTRPFRVGDYISADSAEGTVERIEIMFTALKTFDNKEVIIPNSKITISTITNFTAMENRRLDLTYHVGYRDDITAAKNLLASLVEDNALALKDPAPLVAVGEHKDSSVAIVAKVWCRKEDYWTLYYDMQEQVKLALDDNGFHIPFPQMDVHMKESS